MISAVIAARGRKYLMMNAPAACLPELEALLPAPRVAHGHPARARRDDRDPFGGRRGRRVGPPAPAQGRRARRASSSSRSRRSSRDACPFPRRRASRRPSTPPFRLQRLDLADVAAGDRPRSRTVAPSSGAAPSPTPRSARPPAQTLADVRERGDAAVQDANARVGGGRTDGRLVLDADGPPRRARWPRPADAPRPRPGDRPRHPLRRDATADLDAHRDRPRHRDRTPLEPAGQRRRLRPGRLGAVPEHR